MAAYNPLVSVIIPVKEIGYFLLWENFPALNKQTYTNFEVIVLPSEHTRYDLTTLQKYKWLRIVPTGKVTRPAEKRDWGVKEAKGEIIAFIDDDAYPSPEWLTKAVSMFQKKKVAAVAGPGVLPEKVNFWERVFDALLKSYVGGGGYGYRFTPQKARYVDDYPSMNFFIKKTYFDEIGGFNSEYWPGEDSKLCNDLVYKLHQKIYYHPSILIYHHRRNELDGFLRQHDNYGYHRGAFFAHGDANSRRIGYLAPTGLVVYFIILLLVAPVLATLKLSIYLSLLLLPLILYLGGLLSIFLSALLSEKNISVAFSAIVVTLVMHIRYGIMFVKGYLKGIDSTRSIYE